MRRSEVSIQDFADSGEQPEFDLLTALQSDQSALNGDPFLTEEEHKFFVDTFSRTGFTGGVNWYRNFTRNWELYEKVPQRISAPSLMIMAENDLVLPPSAADGMENYCDDLEKVLIKGSGHWTQQEKPEEVSAAIIDWLQGKF
jgi:pimeloyl-ACP methyl ester carboxylesterase